MKSTITRKEDGTISLHITIAAKDVKKTWDEVVTHIVKETTLQGFRKGMAPRDMVEKGLDKMQTQEEVLRKLLPVAYSASVTEHALKPVMSPRIHVEKIADPSSQPEADWEFTAETCETPEVTLHAYKDAVKTITAKSKIIVPGKEEAKGPNMDEVIKAVLDTAAVTVPAILVDAEAERLLSQLLDEVKSLGLSLDQYLGSTHKTIDEVKSEYRARAEQDIKFEFVLQKISEEEKITVEKNEIEEALAKAQSPEERKNLETNMYLLASILRQQKTLDFLRSL